MLVQRLRYLVALSRERHFARAARACNVTQPTLSEGIKLLEQELGVPLVERGQRYEGLTPAGERVLAWAQRIVADYEWMAQEVGEIRNGLTGRLTIGAIPAAQPVLPLLTAALLRAHPRLTIRVISQTSGEIQRGLSDYSVDVGLTYLDDEALPHVRTQPLYREQYMLATPSDGPLGASSAVRWSEIAALPLCLLDPSMQNRRILDAVLASAGTAVAPRVETTSLLTVCAHVRSGEWSTILPQTFAPLVSHWAGVHLAPMTEPIAVRSVGLVVADRQPLPPLARALLAAAGEVDVDRWLTTERAAHDMAVGVAMQRR